MTKHLKYTIRKVEKLTLKFEDVRWREEEHENKVKNTFSSEIIFYNY